MFSLRDTELFTLKPDSPVPQLREELEAAIHQTVPKFTLSLLLKPHTKIRLRLGFLPSDYTLRSSLLLIRNNLTVIEPVVVYGRGARIGMRVEGVEARSKTPLLFEIRHDHLSDCNNPKRKAIPQVEYHLLRSDAQVALHVDRPPPVRRLEHGRGALFHRQHEYQRLSM